MILAIILILFGGTQIPRLMRSLGQGVSEFKKGVREGETEGGKKEAKQPGQEGQNHK